MWARVIEFMLALWLALSPFIFNYPKSAKFLWTNDYICASLIALFALLSFWYPLRKIHLLTLLVALWLWALGYRGFPEAATSYQENSVILGILLFMLAIIPSHSDKLSNSWQKFLEEHEETSN